MQYAKAFREQTGIKFPLLIDERRQAYGALELKKASLLHRGQQKPDARSIGDFDEGYIASAAWAKTRFS